MRWPDRVGVIFLLATAITASTAAHAVAGSTCFARYRIGVLRENGGYELDASVCEVGQLVRWLHVTPQAVVTQQRPAGDLSDAFTVTITDESGLRRPIVAEVYPSAANGPVVHVLYKTVFRTRSPNRTWVVPAGWRTLDASEQIPALLRKLGMFQSTETPPSPSVPAAALPTPNPSGRPDLVTLVFLLAVITGALVLVRQSISARKRGTP